MDWWTVAVTVCTSASSTKSILVSALELDGLLLFAPSVTPNQVS
jgi:hypothetical protein